MLDVSHLYANSTRLMAAIDISNIRISFGLHFYL